MITQIALLPPTKPVPEPAPSSPSTTTNTANSANPAPTDPTTPTDFKQALHSARGKHKPAQSAQPVQTSVKKTAPAAAKAKVVTPQPTDDEESDPAKPDAVSEEEAVETSAKSATTPAPDDKSTKQAGKKNTSANTESDTETSEPETTHVTDPTKLVQPVTPENPQTRGGKQQKSKDKSPQKPDVAPVAANAAVTLASSIPSQHETKSDHPSSMEPAVLPAAKGQNQQVIQPHAKGKADTTSLNASDVDSSAVITNASDAATLPADADADSSDAASTPSVSSSSSAPAAHVASAISTTLDTLAAITPTHSNESTAAPPSVSPTRAFADANQDQIVTTIKGQLLPDGGSMQITLHPDNLGHVHISVQVSGGSVSATFETTTDQATRLLSHSLSQLKQTLESAGVVVEKLQVTQTHDSQPQTQSDSRQSSQQPQTATDQRSTQQEKQRQEILQQMWDKIAGAKDWIDVKA